MKEMIYRQDAYNALVEKGQASRRYKLGETWELNGTEIREALDSVPLVELDEPNESEAIDNILFILNRIWICGGMKNYSDYCELHDAIKMIDSLVQKTGKWVYKTTNAYIQRTCSACGWSERIYCNNRKQDGLIRNYCPNCGAKMEE